jgi:hypothetical protein
MRKGVSILFILVMMLSAARLTIAIHYCSGKFVAAKVSLSGKVASCGMVSTEKNFPLPGNNLISHCCDDQITTIGICNLFTSTGFFFTENLKNLHHIFQLPVSQSFHSTAVYSNFYTSISPPGRLTAAVVNFDDICVLRI